MDSGSSRSDVLERWNGTRRSGIQALELTFWNDGITQKQVMTRLLRRRAGGESELLEGVVDRMITGRGLQPFQQVDLKLYILFWNSGICANGGRADERWDECWKAFI